MRKEGATSEIIGAILLLSLVIIGLGIVGSVLLFDIIPEKLPRIEVQAWSSPGTLFIVHQGGDALSSDSIEFHVNGIDTPAEVKNEYDETWTGSWKLGEVLHIDHAAPQYVQIIYVKGRGKTLLTNISEIF